MVWKRRHIESYLLVPAAIRRCIERDTGHPDVDRFLADHLPDMSNDAALREFDAKQLLGNKGPISRTFSRPIRPRDIVHCMSPDDIHSDIREFFQCVLDTLSPESAPPERSREDKPCAPAQ